LRLDEGRELKKLKLEKGLDRLYLGIFAYIFAVNGINIFIYAAPLIEKAILGKLKTSIHNGKAIVRKIKLV